MFNQESLDRRYRQIKRATVARSVLDVIALIFLGCAFAFWGVAFWQLLTPPALFSLLSIQAVVLALVYSLATPLLWSALVPSTPAGQLLQKTQWRTFGFAAIVMAALYLSYQAEWMIETWLYNQPGVAEAGMARSLAFSLSIAFILIPALAWTQLTPERWLQQIQQAHQVKRLEMQQRGDLAIIKARLLWAEQRAAVSFANLLPGEQQEIISTMRGLFMAIGDTQRDIARTLGIDADLTRNMMDDPQIADTLDYVAQKLLPSGAFAEQPADDGDVRGALESLSHDLHAVLPPRSHQDATPVAPHPRPAMAGDASPPLYAAVRRATPRYAAEYEVMFKRAEHGVWGVGDLAAVIGKSDRSARERISAWMDEGLVARDADGRNVYYFTESEVA